MGLTRHRKKHRRSKTRRRRNTKLSPVNCSPKNISNNFTCYTNENLFGLKELWNARHPDNPVTATDERDIWRFFKDIYSSVCNKESCWINYVVKKQEDKHRFISAFAPKAPASWKKNKNEWLSSTDIHKVMKQYEKKYRCFEFIGPSPIDFDSHMLNGECVWQELCELDIQQQILNKKTKIGIIFNTDPHNKPGAHWISLFINIKRGEIYFFDSAGSKIPTQIMNLVDRITKQGTNLNPPIHFTFDQNYPVEHQYKNTECGMYSIYFLIHMLEDKFTKHYLKTHRISDEYIETFRNKYYNGDL